ncbi:MAG: hypothetical protein EOP48_12395 [Sphingobacteriales bacterium]|nr:MAG: hypothetical protein EOP48_12395 [Sphingobacteriales bacterium]
MSYNNYIEDLATKVNYLAFQQYLLHKGWRKVATKREDVAAIISPDDNPNYDLLIPLSRAFADYGQSITQAIKRVANFENRDEIQLVNDLIAPPSDIVRYRVENEATANGIIPLKAGFDLLESARKSLLAAASDVLSPSLYHKRMSYKQATQFIDACYLGQSERGSYIASIICPFVKLTKEEKPAQLSLFSTEETLSNSITRSVTKKLMSSVVTLKRAIEAGDTEQIEKAQANNIISVNFLESLVEMNEFTQGSIIEISTTWAPTIPTPENVPNSVQITNDYIEPIKSLIDKIRPEIVETKGDYVGKISGIEANPDVQSRENGEITFVFINDEQKAMSAKVTLSAADIHNAMKAFDEGKNVRITGILKILSRQKIIESGSFQIIE